MRRASIAAGWRSTLTSASGLAIPRTAAAQQRTARAVPAAQLAAGDLVFFHIRSRAVDHVGIYSGGGRFIHAPRAGHAVEYADLRKGFYRTALRERGPLLVNARGGVRHKQARTSAVAAE